MISIEEAKIVCKIEEQKKLAEQLGMTGWLKYLDEDQFIDEKLEIFKILKLNRETKLKVLDIGAGLGHFGNLCKHFGHDYLGTYYGRTNLQTQPFFDISNLNQTQLGFFPDYDKNIPEGPWDVIVMIRTTFESTAEWSSKDWQEVYDSCWKNLNPGGQLLIKSNLTSMPSKKYGRLEYECVSRLKDAFPDKTPLPQWQWMTYHWIKE